MNSILSPLVTVLLILVIGLIVYLYPWNPAKPKLEMVGLHMFWVAMLVYLLATCRIVFR